MEGGSVPSPFSTGGGGYEYERKVAATYLAAMVCGDAAPGVDCTVTEVKFQQRGAGHLLDDLVVVSDKGGRTSRLSLQVKHGLRVGASSEFRDVIADCWQMFVGGEDIAFDRSADLLGIVVPHVSGDAYRHYLPVLEMARGSADGATFWSRLKRGDHSKLRLNFAVSVKNVATDSSGSEATDDDVWKFFRLLYIIVLDMDGPAAAGRTDVKGMCRRALSEPSESEAAKLFDALRGVAADLASAGGSITAAALKGRLSAFDLRGHEKTVADAGRLVEHSRTVMGGIKTVMAGKVALPRTKLLEKLDKTTNANPITVIHGEPFAGKSALAKAFAEKTPRTGAVLFFGADHLGSGGSLEAFLHSLGVSGTIGEMLETHGTSPHRYVVIDGFDRLSYEPEKARVAEYLLAAVSRYNAGSAASAAGLNTPWKIIVTTRGMHLEDAVDTVKRWSGGLQPATLEVGRLDDEDLATLSRQAPQLAGIIEGRLGGLLSLPGYLDMIAGWQLVRPDGAPRPICEGWLYDRFWKEVVLRRGGLREGRGHGLDRERLLLDMAKRAHSGRPPADLHGLDPDAVDGLLTDALVKKIGSRLAFAHDVIEDYALARMIECAEPRRPLFENAVNSRRLVRPLRICAAKMLEVDSSADRWESLFEDCRLAGGNVWSRECLLGAADSDEARSNLDTIAGALLRDGGRLLATILAALPSAFLRDDPHAARAAGGRGAGEPGAGEPGAGEPGAGEPGLHPAYRRLPRDERFSPVLLFALDNMERLGGAATAQFIMTAAKWASTGTNSDLKRRIAEYAERHADWLHDDDTILGQDYKKSDKVKDLVASIILYSSDAAPDLVKKFMSGNPSIIHNEHFKRGLIKEYGWMHLCRFLPDVAVDVLSRMMCTGPAVLGPLKDIPELYDDGWTDLPSPQEGSFYPLLASHSKHGLELVHKFINHVTDQWRKYREAGTPFEPPRTPLPQTVHLESGPVEVYGDEEAFVWCGHARRVRDLVASALMALELWLDGQVEHGKEPVAALFGRVLRGTNSAAVVGVCCTVALRHMGKSAEAVLPILANPSFWIMEANRLEADAHAVDLIHVLATVSGRGQVSEEKYKLEMRHAAARRDLGDLGDFVPLLLFGGPDTARTKMQEALKAFPNHVPAFFKDEIDDERIMEKRRRSCEMWSKQACKSNYKSPPASAGTEAAFDEARFLTGDEKEAERQRLVHEKVMDFTEWSHVFIQKDRIGPGFTIKSALKYAEQAAEDGFMSSLPRHRANNMVNGRANLAGAMVIHRWDRAVEMGVADACIKHLEDLAGAIDPRPESSHPYGPDQAVAYALPHCYLRGGRARAARNAIRKFADAHNDSVIESLMRGLHALWGREDKLVLKCIERVEGRSHSKRNRFGRPYTDWTGYAAVLPALYDIPPVSGGTERRLERMIYDMLEETIAEFKKFEQGRGYEGSYPSFRSAWCPGFFKVLESYIAGRPALRGGILTKIAAHWEAAPPFLEDFMQFTLIWGVRTGRTSSLLAVWRRLLPAVINSKFATGGYRDERVTKSILALLIFADSDKAVKSEERLELVNEFTDEVSSWCVAFAGHKDAIVAIASLLIDAPPLLLLLHGIGWLWQVLQGADRDALPGGAVKMLSHLLHAASTCERPSGALPDFASKYTRLVDWMVSLNDPVAESLKDEGANPYAGADGRDGR